MSRFGWDLPPGVRTSDLPGNSPEDGAAEAAYDVVFAGLYAAHRCGYTVEQVLEVWRDAAEFAERSMQEEAAAEHEAEERLAAQWREEAGR